MSYEVCHYANTCASQSANNKVNDFAIFIRILYRIAHRIDIQIAALDDGHKTGGVVVVVELQGVIAVDHVAYVPVGVLLGKAADDGAIVSGPEIVSPGPGGMDALLDHYTGFCLGVQGSGTVVGTLFNFFGKSHRKQKRTLDRKAKVSYNGFTIIMATICAQEGLVPFSSIHCRRHHYGIWIGNRSRYCCQY